MPNLEMTEERHCTWHHQSMISVFLAVKSAASLLKAAITRMNEVTESVSCRYRNITEDRGNLDSHHFI